MASLSLKFNSYHYQSNEVNYRSLTVITLLHYILTGNSNALLSTVGATIKQQVQKAMNDHSLCNSIVTRVSYFNITELLSATAKLGIDNVCVQTPAFATVILSAPLDVPPTLTTAPSSPPTEQPTPYHSNTERNRLYGILAIIIFTAVLRLLPAMIDCCVPKKNPKSGHLYDILVVLNNTEEAILQNIRHEDIAYYRSVTSDTNEDLAYEWTMNNKPAPLEKRVEVHFLDQYDLLGHSGDPDTSEGGAGMGILSSVSTKIAGDKCVTQRMYMHEASLQVGMIIRVIPSPDYTPQLVRASAYAERPGSGSGKSQGSGSESHGDGEDLDSFSRARIMTKKAGNRGTGQSFDVLHQLPSCYSTRRPLIDFDNRVVPGPGYISTLVGSSEARWEGDDDEWSGPGAEGQPMEASERMSAARGRASSTFNNFGLRSARQSPSPSPSPTNRRGGNDVLCTSTSIELYAKSSPESGRDRRGAVEISEQSRPRIVGSPSNLLPTFDASSILSVNVAENQIQSDNRFEVFKGQVLRRRNSPPSIAMERLVLEVNQSRATSDRIKHLIFNTSNSNHATKRSMRVGDSHRQEYEIDEEKDEDSDGDDGDGDNDEEEKDNAGAARGPVYKL